MSLLLLLLLPGVGVAEGLSPVQVRFHAFPNGLSLYHVKLDEATTYKLSITVWVGSVDEDREKNGGVSHLLEHILFHQPDMPQTEFKAQITSRGGTHNGETSEHYTRYYVSLPTRHLDLGQRWLHKVLFHDRLTTDRLEQEKEIVNRENEWSSPSWWQQLQNLIDPRYLEVPGFWKRQFGLPEYDQLPEGTYEVASRLTASQLEAHYRAYYYPENMVLLYVGPHELEEVIALVGPTFGSVPPTGREANLSRLLDNEFPRPHLSHELPGFFSRPVYQIGIGHVFTGLRFSQLSGLTLYQSVLQQLLEDRFRYGTGKTYSVWGYWDRHRGAGHLQFNLEAGVDTYWIQLNELKDLVWGDLGEHLSQKEYERYKTTLSEQVASVREPTGVHHLVWGAINQHPLHRPSPNEIDLYGPWRSLSYQDFLDWVRTWRGQTAPLLELSMPAFPFPYANSLAFAFSLGLGAYLTNSLLRRPFPRENMKLITRVPYGILGWIHLGLLYAVAAFLYFHLSWGISYGTLFFSRVNALALLQPYLESILGGLLIGLAIVMGGLIMPRKVLVTDGALVVKMRSPFFFRIPIKDIRSVEPVSGWSAWRNIVRLRALPVYPWFLRGLLIDRKSGPALLLHTKDDRELVGLLSSRRVDF